MIGRLAPSLVNPRNAEHAAALRAGYSWRTLEWALAASAAPYATRVARHAAQQLEEVRRDQQRALVDQHSSDRDIRRLAALRAEHMAGALSALPDGLTVEALNAAVQPLQGRPFRYEGERPQSDQLRAFVSRARCDLWWRRCLRRACVLDRERSAHAAGSVSRAARTPYCTHETTRRHAQRRVDIAAMMEATELENSEGQVMTLAKLAAASTSAKPIRRGELMTRIAGCESLAEQAQARGVFLTLTAPSRFHRRRHDGGCNPAADAAIAAGEDVSPRAAQDWLCKAWARARAKLERLALHIFGFRVAEPHHDGCPHWHALLWASAEHITRACEVIRAAWLKRDGAEPGAQRYRVKIKAMEAGGAAAYIAKYIAKNIDDAGSVGIEGHRDERRASDYGPDVPEPAQADLFGGTAQRVEAWASAWGIRQFQAIGQPPVTVWRELRRVPMAREAGHTERVYKAMLACNRDGDRRADWAAFVAAAGGVCAGRNYLLRIATVKRMQVGRYESREVDAPVGVYDVARPDVWAVSDRKEWRPRGEWRKGERGIVGPLAARPWTRVNNCTRTIIAGQLQPPRARLKTWLEIIEQGPGAGLQEEPPCTATPQPSPPISRQHQTTSELLSSLLACAPPSPWRPNSSPRLPPH